MNCEFLTFSAPKFLAKWVQVQHDVIDAIIDTYHGEEALFKRVTVSGSDFPYLLSNNPIVFILESFE